MIRAFQNNIRIATAVTLKDNTLLQVYPEKKAFPTQDEWKATFTDATFVEQERVAVVKAKKEKVAVKKNKSDLSYLISTDTPMQRVVRQLFYQLGLRDSVSSYYTSRDKYFHPRRYESGLYVMMPSDSRITPVHFNYKSGQVFFSGENQVSTSLDGLLFFRKQRFDLIRVMPILQVQHPDQKAVVILSNSFNSYQHKMVNALVNAGYYILFMMNKWYPSPERVKALYALPNVKGVLSAEYGTEINIHPLPKEGEPTNYYFNRPRMSIEMWIAKNQ